MPRNIWTLKFSIKSFRFKIFIIINYLLNCCQTLLELLNLQSIFLILKYIRDFFLCYSFSYYLCLAAHLFTYIIQKGLYVHSTCWTVLHHHSASVVLVQHVLVWYGSYALGTWGWIASPCYKQLGLKRFGTQKKLILKSLPRIIIKSLRTQLAIRSTPQIS